MSAEHETVLSLLSHGSIELYAPVHWIPEVIGVLVKKAPQLVDDAIRELYDFRPNVVSTARALTRAAAIAASLNHHLYDTLYHAVALETASAFVTADERYFNNAQSLGGIMLLRDFKATGGA